MTSRFMPYCLGVALIAALVSKAAANGPVVCVSAFAGGEATPQLAFSVPLLGSIYCATERWAQRDATNRTSSLR